MRPVRYYGRPRGQVLQMQTLAQRGRTRCQKRIDRYAERALATLHELPAKEREQLERWIQAQLDEIAVGSFALAVDWFLGTGLNQHAFQRVMTELWSEEYLSLAEAFA